MTAPLLTSELVALRRLLRQPPTCPDDTRIGHRLTCIGAPDRHRVVLPRLLRAYSVWRLFEHRNDAFADDIGSCTGNQLRLVTKPKHWRDEVRERVQHRLRTRRTAG